MQRESITIILPLPSKVLSPNCTIGSIGGRFAKAAAVKRYRRLAREAVEAERVESMPWSRVSVRASFFFHEKRRRDQDNAMASLKAAYDGIVDSGLVPDDDYEHMARSTPVFLADEKTPCVVLTITREDR